MMVQVVMPTALVLTITTIIMGKQLCAHLMMGRSVRSRWQPWRQQPLQRQLRRQQLLLLQLVNRSKRTCR
jgi:hypothetical protein